MIRYYFVYELSYNNKPFYIGLSNLPVLRYKAHIYDPKSKANEFIRFMIYNFELYPSMNLIMCADNWNKGLELEQSQIDFRLNEGYDLLNLKWLKMPEIRLKKKYIPIHVLDTITNEQIKLINEYEQQNNNRLFKMVHSG